MIKELTRSGRLHDSADGTERQRVFHCSWQEAALGYGTLKLGDGSTVPNWFLPVIGDIWPGQPALTANDWDLNDLGDDANCELVVSYSTQRPNPGRAQRPDEITSWEENLDFDYEEKSVTSWINTDGDLDDWENLWLNYGPTGKTKENKPELIQRSSKGIYTLTIYGSKVLTTRILNNQKKVNNGVFLSEVAAALALADPYRKDDASDLGDDTGKWLFLGCRRNNVKRNVWQYEMCCLWDPDGWNIFYGIDLMMYHSFDMAGFLDDMKKLSEDTVTRFGR